MLARFKDKIDVPAGSRCMHEFVLSPKSLFKNNVSTLDVAKKHYAPIVYSPLIVEEAARNPALK
jgi:glycine dehydrogenase subunit 2